MSEFSSSDSGLGRFFGTVALDVEAFAVFVALSVVCVFLGAALGLAVAAAFFTGALDFYGGEFGTYLSRSLGEAYGLNDGREVRACPLVKDGVVHHGGVVHAA